MLQVFIENYGYFAVFIGCFFEGETVLVLAGFAAHLGYLSLPLVVATAAAAGFCGDQTFFALGRRYGAGLRQRFPLLMRGELRVRKLASSTLGLSESVTFSGPTEPATNRFPAAARAILAPSRFIS